MLTTGGNFSFLNQKFCTYVHQYFVLYLNLSITKVFNSSLSLFTMKFHQAAPALLFLAVSASGFGSFPVAFGKNSVLEKGKIDIQNQVLQPRGGSNTDKVSSTCLASTTESQTSGLEAIKNFVTEENFALLTPRGKSALENLILGDVDQAQTHVYADWPAAGVEDDEKIKLCEQVRSFYFTV